VERWIVNTHDGQLTFISWNEYGLIDQECDLVPVGEFRIVIDGHAAVMVVVPQSDEHRCDRAKLCEKSEQVRQSFRHIKQVAGNENPVGMQITDPRDDQVVARKVLVEMQVAQVHGSAPCQGPVPVAELGDIMVGQADFPPGHELKKPVEWFTHPVADRRAGAVRP
jgi:hypothetical protein